ncbi:MAG: hypothetical protein SFX19_07510 [Alphaproteobacteria bacterium]|nr:hypothetical protein [Alphaproteobacteria bacterium]
METTRAFGWSVGLFFFSIRFAATFFYSLPGDGNVYIFLAGRMLDGEHYFTDFFEYNTPFAVGLYALPLMMGRWLGAPDVVSAKLFIGLLCLLSVGLVHLLIRGSKEWSTPLRYNAIIIAIFCAFSFCFFEWTTKSLPFICLVLPYIFSLHLRIEKTNLPPTMNYVTGVFQGLVILLKPHYALFFLVTEFYLAWRMRSWKIWFRLSNYLAALVVVIGDALILPFFFSGYLEGLFYFVIYYSAAMIGWVGWVDNFITTLLYLLPLLLWQLAVRRVSEPRLSTGVFMAAMVAQCMVLYSELLLSYDQKSLLVFFIAVLLLYSLLLFLYAPLPVRHSIGWVGKGVAGVACVLASVTIFRVNDFIYMLSPHVPARDVVSEAVLEYTQRYAPHEPIYIMSESVEHTLIPLLSREKQPYPVFHTVRPLVDMADRKALFLSRGEYDEWQKAEAYYYDSVLRFFEKTPPRLVFVSTRHAFRELGEHCLPVALDIMLADNAEFAALWTHYRKIGSIITSKDEKFMEERKVYHATLMVDGQSRPALFPVESPMGSWLDVYLRRD